MTQAMALCIAVSMLTVTGRPALAGKPDFKDVAPQALVVEARPFALDRFTPDRTRFGKLIWLGGLALSSKSPYFGGYSGLLLNADGTRLLAVSDAGLWLAAGIKITDGRATGLLGPRTGSLRGRKNRPLVRLRHRDAEAMAPGTPGQLTGYVYIGFERLHRVGRFPLRRGGLGGPTRYLAMPKLMRKARGNAGFEALARLGTGPRKGAVLAFAERFLDAKGDHRGWILGGKAPQLLTLERRDDFDVTGAATLPDGDVLILERRFSLFGGIATRIRRLRARDIKPGARLQGEILLDLGLGTRIDNMEGLAIHRSPSGQTVITLISDDNFNRGLQSTLLMQFALPPDTAE